MAKTTQVWLQRLHLAVKNNYAEPKDYPQQPINKLKIIFFVAVCNSQIIAAPSRILSSFSEWALSSPPQRGHDVKSICESFNFTIEDITPLVFMALRRNQKKISVLKAFLDSGISPDIQDKTTGDTLLIVAVKLENIKAIQILLKYKADPHINNNSYHNTFFYIRELKSKKPNESTQVEKLFSKFPITKEELTQKVFELSLSAIQLSQDNTAKILRQEAAKLGHPIAQHIQQSFAGPGAGENSIFAQINGSDTDSNSDFEHPSTSTSTSGPG